MCVSFALTVDFFRCLAFNHELDPSKVPTVCRLSQYFSAKPPRKLEISMYVLLWYLPIVPKHTLSR